MLTAVRNRRAPHIGRLNASEWARLTKYLGSAHSSNKCWLWKGYLFTGGYAGLWIQRRRTYFLVHRIIYTLFKGAIPKGLCLDHLCRVPRCVNPNHLEAVTIKVNTHRGISPAAINATKFQCKRGHPLKGLNLRYQNGRSGRQRVCRTCQRIQAARRFAAFRRLHGPGWKSHWKGTKIPSCSGCTRFREEARNAGFTGN